MGGAVLAATADGIGIAKRATATVVAACALVAAAALLAPASASAGKFVDRFVAGTGSSGSGQGQLNAPRGLAVNYSSVVAGSHLDPTGDPVDGYVYIADSGNHRIQVYSPDGQFRFMWGRGVQTGANLAEVCDRTETPCQGSTSFSGVEGGMFNQPQGVAIDQDSGHVFVRDTANRRVQEFGADGSFVKAWGWGVDTGAAAFEVCTTSCQAGRVGQGEGDGNGGQLAASTADATGIAVNPLNGDVIVADPGNRRIQQFNPAASGSAVFVRTWGWDVATAGSSNAFETCTATTTGVCKPAATGSPGETDGRFGNEQPNHLAVGSDGTVYANKVGDIWSVQRFDTTQAAAGGLLRSSIDVGLVVSGLLHPEGAAAIEALDIDAASGSLLVARGNGVGGLAIRNVVELATPDATPSHVDTHYADAGLIATGLAIDPDSGDLFLASASSIGGGGHRVFAADDDGAVPAISDVLPATDVSARGASLSGSVNSNGPFPTDWRLEVSHNGIDWTTVNSGQVPGGNVDVAVSGQATGLRPNTLYRVRVSTRKAFGNPEGPAAELTFATDAIAPEIVGVRADDVQATSARLSGRVNPHSTQTRYRFEYGAGNLHEAIPVPDAAIGAGPDFEFVAQQLTGLQPNTVYSFRLVATSATEGPSSSMTKTFTTPATAAPGDTRGYELVSPPDKVSGIGLGDWYDGPGSTAGAGFAAYRGERFAAQGTLGSMLLDNAGLAYANDIALAERIDGVAGWQSHPAVTNAAARTQSYHGANVDRASDDLGLMTWTTNSGGLMPFEEMADWTNSLVVNPGFVGDWQGRWEILCPSSEDPTEQVLEPNHAIAIDRAVAAAGPTVAWTSRCRGVTGPGDPTHPNHPDLEPGSFTTYAMDVSAGLANRFHGNGVRSNVGVCTTGTTLPARVEVSPGVFRFDDQACPAPGAGRDAALISRHGARIGAAVIGAQRVSAQRAVSEDGSRVFFHSPAFGATPPSGCTGSGATSACPAQVYVRQRNPDGSFVTRWISKPADGLLGAQEPSLAGEALFEGASADGSRVFFRTAAPLTVDDPNGQPIPADPGLDPRPVTTGVPSQSSWDLYMFELADGPDPTGPGSKLTRISGGPDGDSDCNSPLAGDGNVSGLRFVSATGRRAYFTCAAPLDGVDADLDGTRITEPAGSTATSDQTNLYLHDSTGPNPTWRFVARLPRAGSNACATTGTISGSQLSAVTSGSGQISLRGGRCVYGSSDGGFVTVWTTGQLTADDPNAISADVYGYDAASGELTRLTAVQGGVGGSYPCGSAGAAASIPCHGDNGFDGLAVGKPILGVATDPVVAGDRVAFFQSRARLTADDRDGAYDVYQWRNGVLTLLTSGRSDSEGAFYKGSDRTGQNVYFVTRDRYSWQDHDQVLDAYTARIDGGIAQPPLPPMCAVLAGGCQGGGTDRVLPAVRSEGSSPDGNAVAIRRRGPALLKVGARAKRRAVRSGVLALRIRAHAAGKVRLVVRARLRKRHRVVGRASKTIEPGVTRVAVRLKPAARRALRRRRALRVSVEIRQTGVEGRSINVLLKRGGR
jgi:hypothetical protein